jgi:Fur family transcriptional regulator, iron response regulator
VEDQRILRLRDRGIQPTPQRLAVAEYVLSTIAHPSADQVWTQVRRSCPTVSRATVYNTLKLFAEKGLVKAHCMREGALVFDGCVDPHHHFIDEETGRVYDVAWEAITVKGPAGLKGFRVNDYQVVMHGRKRAR